MKKILACALLIIIVSPAFSQTVTVSDGVQYQTIEGFGGFGAKKVWWESGPWHDAGYLNTTVDDLGVTFFRTQIYWDGELSNDNADPMVINPAGFNFGPSSDNGKQFPFIKDLHAKGAKLIATVWTPPVWMKLLDEPDRVPDECYNCWQCPVGAPGREMCGGRLNPDLYEEFAEYLVAYVKKLKEETDVDLYGISIQNEPFFANPFESNVVMPEEYGDLLKVVGQRFKNEGLNTKFFGPEHMAEWSWGWQEKYVDETLGDPEVKPLLDIYAVHGYVDGVAADYGSAEGWTSLHENITVAHGKPLWMTETSDFDKQGFDLGMSMAKSLYLALKFGHISAWVYWSMNEQMVVNNKLTPLGYSFKQYYRFVRPGTVRIEAESDDTGVLTVAFKHPQTDDVTIILINHTNLDKSVQVNTGFEHGDLSLYRTSATESCVDLGLITSETVALPAQSISTLTTIKGAGIVNTEKKSELKFRIFPNPTKDEFRIELPESNTRADVLVTDLLGRPVHQSSFVGKTALSMEGWNKGPYLVHVSTNIASHVEKLVLH